MTSRSPSRRGATAASATPLALDDITTGTTASTTATSDSAANPHRWKALGVLAAGLALIVIDGSIVAVSLPTIVSDLSLDLSDAQWVTTSYAVILSALLLISGRVGDRMGRRRLFLGGVALFVIASVLAALASGAATLIGARLLQGVGGALILPSTLSSVNATFRGRERAAAFGVWGAVMAGAAALGPLLGGWLTSSFSWPWIFLVNVPIGLMVLLGTVLWVGESRESESARRGRLDLVGAVLSALSFGVLVFAVIEATTLGWWTQKAALDLFGRTIDLPGSLSLVPVLLLVGALLLAAFVLWERRRATRGEEVLLDLSLFGLPAFSWGNLTAGTVAIGEFGLLFVLPLYLVNVRGLGTLHAGFVLAAMAGGALLSGMAARHLAAMIGAPRTVLVGLGLEVVGVVGLGLFLSTTTSIALIVVVLVLYGLGLGLASAQLTSTVLAPVPADQSGQGSAAQSTVRQLGTALGTAISGALLAAGLSSGVDTLTGGAARYGQALTDSAGSILPQLRAQGAGPAVLAPLDTVFSDGSRLAMLGAAGFLLLGLVGAVFVARAARRAESPSTS